MYSLPFSLLHYLHPLLAWGHMHQPSSPRPAPTQAGIGLAEPGGGKGCGRGPAGRWLRGDPEDRRGAGECVGERALADGVLSEPRVHSWQMRSPFPAARFKDRRRGTRFRCSRAVLHPRVRSRCRSVPRLPEMLLCSPRAPQYSWSSRRGGVVMGRGLELLR